MKVTRNVIACILLLLAGGTLLNIAYAYEPPEHGKKEFIDAHYGELLRSLDAAADGSSSPDSFAAGIATMNLPPEVLYIGTINDKEKTDIIKRFDWNSRSVLIINHYGSGKLGAGGVKKEIMIYENDGPWDYMDKFVVYIEYKEDVETNPDQ